MQNFTIYYRNNNGHTEHFRVTARSDFDAVNRFHKVIGFYPILRTVSDKVVALKQQPA